MLKKYCRLYNESKTLVRHKQNIWPSGFQAFVAIGHEILLGFAIVIVWQAAFQISSLFEVARFVSIWYLPPGVSIVFACLFGLRIIPWLMLASLMTAISQGFPTGYAEALTQSARHALIYGLAGWLLAALKIAKPLYSLRDTVQFAIIVLAAALTSAFGGLSLRAWAGVTPWSDLAPLILDFWVGDAIGAVTIPPAVLALASVRVSLGTVITRSRLRTAALSAIVILAVVLIAFGLPSIIGLRAQLWYIIMAPMAWLAVRYGLTGAVLGILTMNLTALPAIWYFNAVPSPFDLQILLLTASITSLLIGAAISDRDRALRLLSRNERALEETVRQRTAELQAAKDQAERASAAKSRFLAATGHDLRQPLHAMGLLIGVLQNAGNPASRRVADKIAASLAALERLLNSLLDIAKLDAGVITPEIGACSLSKLMAELEAEFEPVARAKGLKLHFVRSSAPIMTDLSLFERILRNLIANALRYTKTGTVLVGCRRRGDWLRIEVWDTGIGIPPEQQQLIFREFQQVDASDESSREGLGLGLSIVDGLVRLLGHRMILWSKPGQGSLFAVEARKAKL